MTRTYRIFIINPGSTSTKLSLFENDKNIYTTDVFHDSKVLLSFPTINDQLDYRMKVIYDFLKEDHIDLTGIDAVVGRGGGCYAVPGGVTMEPKLAASVCKIMTRATSRCSLLPMMSAKGTKVMSATSLVTNMLDT